MDRRHFIALSSCLPLCAGELLAGAASSPDGATAPSQASLLLSQRDPFSGLPMLQARYQRGARPSSDMPGSALSWRLTGDHGFAENSVSLLKSSATPDAAHAGRTWADFIAWALTFSWLRGFAGFDTHLQDEIAHHLLTGAEKVLALPDLSDASQASYHNYSLRYLSMAAFTLAASAPYPATAKRAAELLRRVDRAFSNILELTQLVTPEGSYHESMDYARITWVPLTLLAELWRTTTGFDPARCFGLFRNMGHSYLYKLMPDGTPSREGDNEYPVLDAYDSAVLGYAVHRFKDPYAAWLLRESGFVPKDKWTLPVLAFLWDDDQVRPRNPSLTEERELSRQKYFPGVGHLVMRTGWTPESTWIEFDCGPYFAKHQHLAQNHFTIYHKGCLAIDSGADYTDTESPHYLNYYRRTVAHNSILVFDPSEKFFWSENVLAAANDGGQRMDSSRFWNSVRSLGDWDHTRDLWDFAAMRVTDYVPGQYHYALGDATRAYSPEKLKLFTRELVYDLERNILYVFDRVATTRPELHKAWLLHGINEPDIEGAGSPDGAGATSFRNATSFRFHESDGELIVHALLPRERMVTRRGGQGFEFWTPGNEHGGAWGSGENWPLEPEGGSPLPSDQRLSTMWKKFWGPDFARIFPSNRQNVKPGSWRVEVSPATPNAEEAFLHVIEIGDWEARARQVELLDGVNVVGALVDGSGLLFAHGALPLLNGEVTLPGLPCASLLASGLDPNAIYEIRVTGPNIASSSKAAAPGIPLKTIRTRANGKGIARIELDNPGNVRLRISRT